MLVKMLLLYQKGPIMLERQREQTKRETAEETPKSEEGKEGSGQGDTPGAGADIHHAVEDPHQSRFTFSKDCSPWRTP